MKTVQLAKIPDCDVHAQIKGVEGIPALYDGPTEFGSHGYMCQDCFNEVGFTGSSITFRLELANAEVPG